MNPLTQKSIIQLQQIIPQGGIIAYPTESVYGLGCDPLNESAVAKIAKIKGRTLDKGFILIASTLTQIEDFILPPEPKKFAEIKATWPGPVTWVFPCTDKVPVWIRGQHNTVAVRVTAHPIARAICNCLNKAIVSTSANRAGEEPVRSAQALKNLFLHEIDFIVEGDVGELPGPTPIRDALTGKHLRIG